MSVIPSGGIGANLNAFQVATRLGLATNLKLCLDAGDANSIVNLNADNATWVDISPNANNFYLGDANPGSLYLEDTDPWFHIGYVGRSWAGSGNGSDITIVIPTNTIEGDLVVAMWGFPRNATAWWGWDNILTPGYTPITSAGRTDQSIFCAYKFMGATPDTTLVIGGDGYAADGQAGQLYVFRGVDEADPISGSATASGVSSTPISQSVTGNGRTIAITFAGGNVLDNLSITPPGPYFWGFANHTWNNDTLDETIGGCVRTGNAVSSNWTSFANSSSRWCSADILLNGKADIGKRSKNESFKMNGYSYLTYANTTVNPTWMNNLHKDNAKFSIVSFYFHVGGTGYPFRCADNLFNDSLPGFQFYVGSAQSGLICSNTVHGDAAVSTLNSPPININAWNYVGATVDEGVSSGSYLMHNGNYSTRTITYVSPSSADIPAVPSYLGPNGYKIYDDNPGSQFAIVCVWEGQALTQAQMTSFCNGLKARFNL